MKFHILVTQKILNCPVIQLISRDFFFWLSKFTYMDNWRPQSNSSIAAGVEESAAVVEVYNL